MSGMKLSTSRSSRDSFYRSDCFEKKNVPDCANCMLWEERPKVSEDRASKWLRTLLASIIITISHHS
jgi:hypothetical protein